MEVCAGFELIAIENATALGYRELESTKSREAQMIGHMRPWFASATPGASVYPQPQPSGIPADPFSRSPYYSEFAGLDQKSYSTATDRAPAQLAGVQVLQIFVRRAWDPLC